MPTANRELVERAIRGDTSAFASLVEKYQGMVCGLAYDSIGCFAEAEDIAQDTLVDAYRKLPSLRDPRKFGGWLRTAAINKIRTWVRRKAAHRERLTDPNAIQEPTRNASGADEPDAVSLRESVLDAVKKLPLNERLAITLYYMDGQSYADIAGFLNVPVTTVKARMHAGRKRLRKEMMDMVETTFEAEKPGHNLAVRVLRKALSQAKLARKNREYENLQALCGKALEALDGLPPTPKRQKAKMEVLLWHGETTEEWLNRPAEAVANYRKALELATAIGDSEGQTQAMEAILVTNGRAGDFEAMKTAAQEGLALSRDSDNADLLAFCTAGVDLCEDPERRTDLTATGGFVLGHLCVFDHDGAWHLEQPRRWTRCSEADKPNVSVNFRCGIPAHPMVLAFVYGPERLLPRNPRVGKRWQGAFGSDFWLVDMNVKRPLVGRTVVEADDETITVPAGRFPKCLKLKTVIEAAGKPPSKEALLSYPLGTRWMWFAPGTGLVKLIWVDSYDQLTDIVLVNSHQESKSTQYLPLKTGNWWTYQWMERYPGALLTEKLRVVKDSGNEAIVSIAANSRQPSDSEKRQYDRRVADFLRRCSDPHLSAKGLLDSSGSDPGKLSLAAKKLGRLGETELQIDALFRLAWSREKSGRLAEAANVWDSIFEAIKATKHAGKRAHISPDIAGACFRIERYDKMLEVAQWAERFCRQDGECRSLSGVIGDVEIAKWLSEQPGENIGGYVSGHIEVFLSPSSLQGGSRASGTCAPMANRENRFVPPALGMGRLLPLPVRTGKSWTDSWATGSPKGCLLPTVTRKIESKRSTVEATAGNFPDCVRVRAEIRTTFGAGGSRPDLDWQGYHDGVCTDWYSPGVGLVKVDFHHANGKTTRINLVDYEVKDGRGSYFPNRIGNTWQFEWHDGDGKLLFREFWRIAGRKGKTTYLAFGAIDYK